MKKLITLSIIFLLPLLSKAQVFADFGMGATVHKAQDNKLNPKITNYTFNLDAGYNLNNLILKGEFYGIANRSTTQPKLIAGLSVGYQFINCITPAIGYYRSLVSMDDRSLNSFDVGYSLEYYKPLGEKGGLFLKGMFISKNTIFTIGARTKF